METSLKSFAQFILLPKTYELPKNWGGCSPPSTPGPYAYENVSSLQWHNTLESLDISSNRGVDDECMELLRNFEMPKLSDLDLNNTNITSDGVRWAACIYHSNAMSIVYTPCHLQPCQTKSQVIPSFEMPTCKDSLATGGQTDPQVAKEPFLCRLERANRQVALGGQTVKNLRGKRSCKFPQVSNLR